jgi:hypothetical protein
MTRSLSSFALTLALAVGTATPLAAPQSVGKTQALAKELTSLLQQQKLDAIAAHMGDDRFAAVLFFPDVQMLAVSARYVAPVLLNEKIITRQYREVYLDLASASVPDSKLFIEDMQGDGLRPRREDNTPFDIVTKGTAAAFALDGDHRKKKISEDEYLRTYGDFEGSYEKILIALIAQAKK